MNDKLKLVVDFIGTDKMSAVLSKIKGGSNTTAKEVKALTDRLKELNSSNEKANNFTRMLADAKKASTALKEAKGNVVALTAKLEQQREAQSKVAGEARTARKSYESLASAVQKLREPPNYMLRNLQLQKDALNKLESSYVKAQNSSRRLKDQIKDANKVVANSSEHNRKLSESLGGAAKRLKEAGVDVHKLSAYQAGLKTNIDATNTALVEQEAKLKIVNDQMRKSSARRADYDKSMATRNKLAGAGASLSVAGVAMGAPVLQTIKAYAELEDAGTQLQAALMQKGGKVNAQFAELNDLAIKLGNRLPGTTADFQNMMTMLVRQGMSAKTILGGLGEATAYLGVQTKMSQTEAAEFAAKLQGATRTTERDMMGLMDTIQKTFYLGVDQNDMLQAFSKMTPALTTLKKEGLEAARALAPLVVMANKGGMAGEPAGNAIRKVLQLGLDQKKVSKGNSELEGTGIKLDFTNGKGNFGGLDNLFAQLAKLKNLTDVKRIAVLKKIFGDDAETHQVLGLIIDQGKAGYETTLAKMDAQAALQDRVNKQLNTLKNLWEAATGTFTNTLATLGETLSPQLKELCDWLNRAAEGVGKFAKAHPDLIGFLMKTAAISAVVITVLGGLLLAAAAVLGPIAILKFSLITMGIQLARLPSLVSMASVAWGFLGKVLGFAWKAFDLLMTSLVRVAGFGLSLLVRGFALLAQGMGTFIGLILKGGVRAFGLLAQAIGYIGTAIRVVCSFLMANPILIAITLLATAAYLIYKNWEPIKAFFIDLFKSICTTCQPAVDWIVGAWGTAVGKVSQVWDGIKTFFGGLWTEIKMAFDGGILGIGALIINWSPIGLFYKAFAAVMSWFGLDLPKTFTGFGSMLMDGLISGINNGLGRVKEAITSAGESTINWFKEKLGIHSPSRVFAELGGYTMAGFDIGLQRGQQGPMDTVLGFGKKVATLGAGITFATAAGASGGLSSPGTPGAAPAYSGGNTYEIHVHAAPGMDEMELARLVERKVAEAERLRATRQRSSMSERD